MSKKARKDSKKIDPEDTACKFEISFYCEPTVLKTTSTFAYDCQFTFQFPGEEPTSTPPRSEWESSEWKAEYTKLVDKDLLFLLQGNDMTVAVKQKMCPYTHKREEEQAAIPKTGKKKNKKKTEVVTYPGVIPRPDKLDDVPFSKVHEFNLCANAFIMDSKFSLERHFSAQNQEQPPPSIHILRICVTCESDCDLLTPEWIQELKPLQIIVNHAEGLPPKPYPYEKMGSCYRPVYATYSFFDKRPEVVKEPEPESKKRSKKGGKHKKEDKKKEESKSKKGRATPEPGTKGKKGQATPEPVEDVPEPEEDPDRLAFDEGAPPPPPPEFKEDPMMIVTTDGVPHGPDRVWDHSKVIFLGQLDIPAMAAYFERKPFCVETHDRDVSTNGLKQATVMSRGAKGSLARMLMVSPEDDPVAPDAAAPVAPKPKKEERPSSSKRKKEKKEKKSSKGKDKKKSGVIVDNSAVEAAQKAQREQLERIKAKNLRGVSLFRVTDIFRGSTDVSLTAPIVPQYPPRGIKLKPFQMKYNPYDTSSQLTIRLRLKERLPQLPTKMSHKFNRVIFMLRYNNLALRSKIVECVKQANMRALKLEHQQWTDLSTVRLTPEEREKMMDEDCITGLEVIDKDYRMFILEGLATCTPNAVAMANLMDAAPKVCANSDDLKILVDESISFYERLYSAYDCDIKKLKLIQPLEQIAATKNIHINKRIPDLCYRAFSALHQMRTASRMRMAKAMNMFPTIYELGSLEKWFGDFVSDEDLGLATKKKVSRRANKVASSALGATTQRSTTAFSLEAAAEDFGDEESEGPSEVVHRVDCYNPEYIMTKPKLQAKRDAHNYVKFGIKDMRDSNEIAKMSKRRFKHRPWDVYELLPHDAPLEIDYDAMKRDDQRRLREQQEREKYYPLENGFRGTNVHEPWNRHPKAPHHARVDELGEPWIENSLRPHLCEKPDHDPGIQVALKIGGEFGMPGNPQWGKSVFVAKSAAGLEREAQMHKEQVRREFQEKLVVDDPAFRVYRKAEHRKNMSSLDKTVPILKQDPKKKALTYNIRMKNSRRRVGPIHEYEQSMYTNNEYVEPSKALKDAMIRHSRPRDPTMHPADYKNFYPYHPYAHKPHIKPTASSAALRRLSAGVRSGLAAEERPFSM